MLTNGVPGLTNPPCKLLLSAVAAESAHGGRVTMVTTQAWARFYSRPGTTLSQATCMAVDDAGNVYVAGQSYTSSGSDFATLKFAPDGTALWTNRYDGPADGDDLVCALAVDNGGNVYVTGYSRNTNGLDDVATLKYSSSGSALWTNRCNESISNNASPAAVVVDEAGSAYVLAVNFSSGSGGPISMLLKYNSAGTPLWTNHYPDAAHPVALARDKAGNLVAAFTSGTDYALLKFTADGSCLWTNRYSRTFGDIAAAMALDPAGNAIVTGDSMDSAHLYATVKCSSDGVSLWTNLLVAPRYQGGSVPRVSTDPAGNIFLTGGSPNAPSPGDYLILKLNPEGLPLWTNRFIGFGHTNGYLLAGTADHAGNYYGAGYSVPADRTNNVMVLVKYAADGTAVWTNRFDAPANMEAYGFTLIVSDNGNIHVAGEIGYAHQAFWQFATVKFANYAVYTPPAGFFGEDAFSFTVTDSAGNSVTSAADVVVLPPPPQIRLRPVNWSATDGFTMQVSGATGTNAVVVYASTNLVWWDAVTTNVPILGACQLQDRGAAASGPRFYRAAQ